MNGEKITITVYLSNIQDITKIKLIGYTPLNIFEEVALQLSKKGKWNVKAGKDISKICIRNKKAHTEYSECLAQRTLVKGDELLIETNVPWVKVKKQRWGHNPHWGRAHPEQWNLDWDSRSVNSMHHNIAVNQVMHHQNHAMHL